ncbi:hypothetical protein [Treponema zioleckii]|uniref:hypothetical protein n=1 Tax=Treponema zioleckii TaxID=331680 RepID=UPI001F5B2D4D|nr:hypothetical protein [Treponema zioleckii]
MKKSVRMRDFAKSPKTKKSLKFLVLGIAVFGCTFFSVSAQSNAFTSEEATRVSATNTRSAESGFGEQEFRRGVQAYYRGAFNDAIVQFEKALAYLPAENMILDWLGKAYYRSGIEGSALQQWEYASQQGYGGLLLKNKIEILRERRITDNFYDTPVKYTESGSFSGVNGENLVFSQPISILPNPDGTAWVLAYGSNELICLDVNGIVTIRSTGPLNGFDRPMDIIRLENGNLLVSEFAGDRISEFNQYGFLVKSFGEKGRGVGGLVGPQYLAQDDDGNIYVSDFGNSRIDVFDKDGNPLFFFGGKQADFAGLKAPTGVAVADGSVFVADAVTGAIYRFDTAGNYIGLLCREKTFTHPESIKPWGNYLVICDKNKVYSIDKETGSLFENVSTGNAPSQITCAVPDANGNILVTDFKTNEIYVMSKMSELIGGLLVQVDRVDSKAFPKVVLDVKVENRRRQSVVGLKDNNFVVTEEKLPVADFKLEGAGYVNDVADITLVLDRSQESAAYSEAMESAVQELATAMGNKGTLRIISAGVMPVVEYEGAPSGAVKFTCRQLKNPVANDVQLDVALRLASNALINGENKRAVVLVSAGTVTPNAFEQYGLADLTTYMNNNSISLVSILLNQGSPDSEISYLCSNTEGGQYYVYRTQGLSGVVGDIINIPCGLYRISYTSRLQTAFGEKYLPVEVETYLLNRSGRDSTGYFAPLE